ncbi:MAG: Na/Pi cotransporter family protein, partial [Kiritimatiellae bacterium]|nr:Na/Pi cotransporter family protein [Kiritimatiellia bacterium]
MKELFLVFATLGSGLGLFLLGMKHLSDGLQAAAGGGLRKFMAHATSHRLVGVGTGVVSTLIVQSSAIITAMLVGFVSSGMLTLPQALNVIIGANIGTTGTVWVVAFAPSPELLGEVGIAVGALLYFFCRRERVHDAGLAVLGLGLLFLGLCLMARGVTPIRDNEAVKAAFHAVNVTTLWDVAEVALAATVLSAAIHSAATIAIAMTLASQGLITYETAIAVLFGANIGTTVTAWLAAIGGTADARRTALAHTLSNVFGSLLLMPFALPVLVPLGKALFPAWNAVTETPDGPLLAGVMAPIAVSDTIFSVVRGVLMFPFVRPFVRLIEWMISQPEDEKPHLSAIKAGVRVSPVIACDQALLEVDFMKRSNLELLDCARKVLAGATAEDDAPERHIVHRENILDNVQKEVTEFLGTIMSKRLPRDVAERAQRLLRLTDELESVSDECATVLKVVKRLKKQGQVISAVSEAVLLDVHDKVAAFAADVTPLIRSPRVAFDLAALQRRSSELHDFVRECRRRQLGRV